MQGYIPEDLNLQQHCCENLEYSFAQSYTCARINFSPISFIEISARYKSVVCWISGLGLGSILSKLRNSGHELVQIQVEVFDEKLHRDQVELEKDPINLSPQQLFDIIYNKVGEMSVSCNSCAPGSDTDLFLVESPA
jgi:hypothetical protein